MKDIRGFEPWFFILFGLFHLHRIWGLLDRPGYAGFWMGMLAERGPLYWGLMAVLGGLCLAGLVLFFRCFRQRRWWRWAYLLGGGYVLFDLFAIAAGLPACILGAGAVNKSWPAFWDVLRALGGKVEWE